MHDDAVGEHHPPEVDEDLPVAQPLGVEIGAGRFPEGRQVSVADAPCQLVVGQGGDPARDRHRLPAEAHVVDEAELLPVENVVPDRREVAGLDPLGEVEEAGRIHRGSDVPDQVVLVQPVAPVGFPVDDDLPARLVELERLPCLRLHLRGEGLGDGRGGQQSPPFHRVLHGPSVVPMCLRHNPIHERRVFMRDSPRREFLINRRPIPSGSIRKRRCRSRSSA